jgi:uncharacterized membrane protein YsdA (DUF1294 family)/cold shock CspA family protein
MGDQLQAPDAPVHTPRRTYDLACVLHHCVPRLGLVRMSQEHGDLKGALLTMLTGVVVSFDQRNGFGFIRSRALPHDVYVHACAVSGGKLLRPGQRVRFEANASDTGPRAVRVEPRRVRYLIFRVTPAAATAVALVCVLAALAGLARFFLHWPWATSWLLAVNVVTLTAVALDKRRAILGEPQLSELFLLGLCLAGGTPGGLAAMTILRHKTRKSGFRLAFAAIALLQAAGAIALWSISGR